MKEYSDNYGMQVAFTTHSLTLIDYSLKQKANVMYLLNERNRVSVSKDIDMFSINMYLQQITADHLKTNVKIPIFTEDQEARDILDLLFMKISDLDNNFKKIENNLHFVSCNIGSNNLTSIFSDPTLTENIMKAICVLDGDANKQINKNIITLPGQKNPESIIFDYLSKLINENDDFWKREQVHVQEGYTYDYALAIQIEINNIKVEIEQKKLRKESIKGIEREKNKKLYNKYKFFFQAVFLTWLNDTANQIEIQNFYNDLYILFNKTRVAYNIPAKNWSEKINLFGNKEYSNS